MCLNPIEFQRDFDLRRFRYSRTARLGLKNKHIIHSLFASMYSSNYLLLGKIPIIWYISHSLSKYKNAAKYAYIKLIYIHYGLDANTFIHTE